MLGRRPLQAFWDILVDALRIIIEKHIRKNGHENQEDQKDQSGNRRLILKKAAHHIFELAVFLRIQEIGPIHF